MRRYFTDAIPKGKEYDYSLPAVQEYNSAPSCLIVSGTQQKITAEQRKQFRLEKGEADTGGILELAGSTAPKQEEHVWRKR